MSKQFVIGTSARHIHVTKEDLEVLFGAGFELSNKKDLVQPGEFATNEKVNLIGPRGELKGITILGPCRKATQVELSFTDARGLGLTPPVRESGDIGDSCGCKIVGPCGEVELKEGVIIAKRHIHATVADAAELGVQNKDIVWVKMVSEDRSIVFGDVVVRVSDSYALEMHIDTDEANAAHSVGEVFGEIVKI